MVKIIADSTSDLTPELIQKNDLEIIPLSVFINGKDYLDGLEITSTRLFDLVEKTNEFPKTSAPSTELYRSVFSRYSELVYIGISSKLSASMQSSLIALETSDPNQKNAIDSKNLSTGIGLLVLKAAEMSRNGNSVVEISRKISDLIPKVHSSFVIDTLDFLYKGGRCSAMEHLAASLLKIRPVIEVRNDGTLGVREKLGGSRKKSILSLVAEMKSHGDELDPQRVFITHCACSEDAELLMAEIDTMCYFEEIIITEAGTTIASHCGPKTIGILYMTK